MTVKKYFIFPGAFLIASFLFYPLLLPDLLSLGAYRSYLILFTAGTLSMMALAWCFLDYKQTLCFCRNNILPTMLIGIIVLGCLLHFLLDQNYNIDYFFSSIVWISIPLFVALNHKFFEKYLPYFLVLLAFLNFIQLTRELFTPKAVFCGIAGNWNWSGALMIISTPFLVLFISKMGRLLKWNSLPAGVLNILIAAWACYYIYLCDSKGIWCALVMSAAVCLGVQYRNKHSIRRALLWIIPAALIAVVIFLYSGGIAKLGVFMLRDVRMQLWTGALHLIGDNFFFGVGQPLFESAYASYNPVEYYLNFFAADRSPHPHNHLLFFLASNGIFSFIAWLILLILPLWRWALRSPRTGSLRIKLYFFSGVFLFFHGLFDMTLEVWPLNTIFLVILGIFWGRYWKTSSNDKEILFAPAVCRTEDFVTRKSSGKAGILGEKLRIATLFDVFSTKIPAKSGTFRSRRHKSGRLPGTVRMTAIVCFAILMSVMAVQLYRNISGSYYFREANIARDLNSAETALDYYDKSISIKPTPESIYQAALIAFYDLKNPALCQLYLDRMEDLTAFRNYVNNNGLEAKALYLQGRRLDSLKYFQQETSNFPLSSVNWYFYYKVLKETGHDADAQAAYDKLSQSLAVKGLRFEHIPLLIKNPRWDMHFREVPGVNFKD